MSGGYIFHATEIIIHDKYDPRTFNFDVAVIRIAENFLVDFLEPVRLADSSLKLSGSNSLATVVGWGTAANDYVPLILQKLKVLVQPRATCNNIWIEQITEK